MKKSESEKLKNRFSRYFNLDSPFRQCQIVVLILFLFLFFLAGYFGFLKDRSIPPSASEVSFLDSLVVKARTLSRLDPDSSLRITLEILERSEKLNYDKGLADSYRLLSITSARSRNFELAQECLVKAESIYKELNDKSGLGDVEVSYGGLAVNLGDTLAATNHYRKALYLFAQLEKIDRMRIASFNLALSFADISRLDSAEFYLETSKNLKQAPDDLPALGEFLSLRGKIEFLKEDYERAEDYFLQALAYDQSIDGNESYHVLFESKLYLSKIYKMRGMIDLSIQLLEELLASDRIYEDETYARKTYLELIDTHESLEDYQRAFSAFLEKEKFELSLERRKVELAKNFSTELSLYRGFQLENERLSSKLSSRNNLILIGGSFTLLIIFFVIRLLFLNLKNRQLTTLVEKSHELAEIATIEVFLTHDQQIKIIKTTPLGRKMIQIPSDQKEFGPLPFSAILDANESRRLQDLITEYKDTGQFINERMTITDLAGNRKILGFAGQIFSQKGGMTAKGIIIDKTHEVVALESALENLEREKTLTELRSQMMHMTSHEFRTPLSTVSNAIELIALQIPKVANPILQEKFSRTVVSARENISKLVSMLDELLLYEHIQSAEFEINLEPVELISFTRRIANDILEGKPDAPILDFIVQNSEVFIQTDPKLLYHILTNLLTNAVKYLDKDLPIEVEISEDSQQVEVRVKDYGIGIPEEDLERLFTPFRRASNVGSRIGTGLGLSIVKRMMNRLGGKLQVESQVGEYTQFLAKFPKKENI